MTVQELINRLNALPPETRDKPICLCLEEIEAGETEIMSVINEVEDDGGIVWLKLDDDSIVHEVVAGYIPKTLARRHEMITDALIARVANRLCPSGHYDADAVQILALLAKIGDCTERLGAILRGIVTPFRIMNFSGEKIPTIKILRGMLNIGLKDAKDFVEGNLNINLTPEQADHLTEAGCNLEVANYAHNVPKYKPPLDEGGY